MDRREFLTTALAAPLAAGYKVRGERSKRPNRFLRDRGFKPDLSDDRFSREFAARLPLEFGKPRFLELENLFYAGGHDDVIRRLAEEILNWQREVSKEGSC